MSVCLFFVKLFFCAAVCTSILLLLVGNGTGRVKVRYNRLECTSASGITGETERQKRSGL